MAVDILALVIQVIGSGVAAVANANHERNGMVSHIMSVGIFIHMGKHESSTSPLPRLIHHCISPAGIILFTSMAVEFTLRFYFQKPLSGNASLQLPLEAEADSDSDIENDIKSEKLLLRGRVATVSSIDSAETLKRSLKGEFPLAIKKVVIALLICTVLVFIRCVVKITADPFDSFI